MIRVKRDLIKLENPNQTKSVSSNSTHLEHSKLNETKAKNLNQIFFLDSLFQNVPNLFSNKPTNERQSMKYNFNDELWSHQWYIYDTRNAPKLSLRITEAWRMGYTGKGIVVAVMDDGLFPFKLFKIQNLTKIILRQQGWNIIILIYIPTM